MHLMEDPHRTMFLYWGRRGALARFTLDAAQAAMDEPTLRPTISVSRQNERFDSFERFGPSLFPVSTFASMAGAVAGLPRVPALRRQLSRRLRQDRIQSAVTLLSHVWSPFVASVVRKAGVRHYVVVHDADPHIGDPTGLLQSWYQRDIRSADRLVTLSRSVTDRLVESQGISESAILTLFHPDFVPERPSSRAEPSRAEPFRLLFLGRVMPYKGLGLLVEAVERLHGRGVPVTVGVYGEGNIEAHREGLRRIGAEVVNRWLSDVEIDAALSSHHALVLSHIEASQSGVAALALGRGLPMIATPVGGLVEQVVDGRTGLLAAAADAVSIADAIERLVGDPALYARIAAHIAAKGSERSMRHFVKALADDMRSA